MPEQLKQFDFSKEEDREKFGKLDKAEQKKIAQESENDAYSINDEVKKSTKVQNKISSDEEKHKVMTSEEKAEKEELINWLEHGYSNYTKVAEYLSKKIIFDDEVQKAATKEFIRNFTAGYDDAALKIKKWFSLSKELPEAPVRERIAGILSVGGYDNVDRILKIIEQYSLSREAILNHKTQKAAESLTIKRLQSIEGFTIGDDKKFEDAVQLKNIFSLSLEGNPIAAKEIIVKQLSKDIQYAIKIKEEFKLNDSTISTPEVQQIAKEAFIKKCSDQNYYASDYNPINEAFEVKDKFNLSNGMVKEVAFELIEAGRAAMIVKYFEKFRDSISDKEAVVRIMETNQGKIIADNLNKFQELDKEIALKLIEDGFVSDVVIELGRFKNLDKEIVVKIIELGRFDEMVYDYLENFQGLDIKKINEYCRDNNLFIDEAILCLYKNSYKEEEREKETDDSGLLIYKKLKNNHPSWKDQENILKPFEAGAETFSYDKMFKYLNRPKLTRHDGLHNFLQIIKSYEVSGLKAPAYYNNILEQVARDDAEYYEGTAHHHLNSLVCSINYDFDGVTEQAKEYAGIEKLQTLMAELGDTKKIFASWKNLKKYREVCELLGRTEILENLHNLKKLDGKEKLYKYIETLAFHPNISMEEVFKLWEDPESFLQNMDTHTPEEVHDRKKPSNYIEIPNLDLTAAELRDALVEGTYDRLQAFTPMEIIYQVGKGGKTDIKEDLARQIGVRDKNLREKLGIDEDEELKSDSKLFAKLNQIFKTRGYDFKKYLNGEEELAKAFVDEIEQFRTKQPTEEYRVKINKKSDPDGVVAGNDTACCMPFGSGKNNVYTFNPICALFTVQKKNADGTYRTIAQSVLTLDKDINENVAKLLNKLNSVEIKLHEVINEDVLINTPSVITCDNIELAENYKSHPQAGQILEEIYRDFFQEYSKRNSAKQNLDTSKVIIGQGYSDSLRHLPEVNNTFVPEAPVGYSDNLHENAYLLELNQKIQAKLIVGKKISPATESERKAETPMGWPRGVSYLTYRDSLPVAYIEGKAYHDNESLIQYLHNMENALIAKDVNNEAKGRKNMSFKYQGSDGKIHGYLLSYEGKRNYSEYDNEESEVGEKVLYVTDLASDGNKRAGGSLMLTFVEEYKNNFLKKNNPVPIFMQLRESTSYPLVKEELDRLSKDTGYKFRLEELGTYQHGDDTMHEAIIRAEKI